MNSMVFMNVALMVIAIVGFIYFKVEEKKGK